MVLQPLVFLISHPSSWGFGGGALVKDNSSVTIMEAPLGSSGCTLYRAWCDIPNFMSGLVPLAPPGLISRLE